MGVHVINEREPIGRRLCSLDFGIGEAATVLGSTAAEGAAAGGGAALGSGAATIGSTLAAEGLIPASMTAATPALATPLVSGTLSAPTIGADLLAASPLSIEGIGLGPSNAPGLLSKFATGGGGPSSSVLAPPQMPQQSPPVKPEMPQMPEAPMQQPKPGFFQNMLTSLADPNKMVNNLTSLPGNLVGKMFGGTPPPLPQAPHIPTNQGRGFQAAPAMPPAQIVSSSGRGGSAMGPEGVGLDQIMLLRRLGLM